MLDAQTSTAFHSSVLYPEYVGYWSQAKNATLYQGKPLYRSNVNISITICKKFTQQPQNSNIHIDNELWKSNKIFSNLKCILTFWLVQNTLVFV